MVCKKKDIIFFQAFASDMYGMMLLAPLKRKGNKVYAKNICIFADGEVDRSPTGTASGGRVVEETIVGEYPAVVPEIKGNAYITGFNQLVLDPRDSFPRGFRIH